MDIFFSNFHPFNKYRYIKLTDWLLLSKIVVLNNKQPISIKTVKFRLKAKFNLRKNDGVFSKLEKNK